MSYIRMILAGSILLRAIYTDLRYERIENKSLAAGFVISMVMAYVEAGWQGVLQGLKMSGLILAAMFFLYLIKGLGAGDIKLFCVLAAFYPNRIIAVIVTAFFIGGVMGLCRMLVRFIRRQQVYIPGETIHFSFPIGISVIMVCWMSFLG